MATFNQIHAIKGLIYHKVGRTPLSEQGENMDGAYLRLLKKYTGIDAHSFQELDNFQVNLIFTKLRR